MVDGAAFLCELALLFSLAVAGSGLGHSTAVHVVLAVALPVLAAGVWSVWMAPTSERRLGDPARFIAQSVVFVAAGVLVALAGHVVWGIVLASVSVIVFAATRKKERNDDEPDPADARG